jgi:hypothetical protein
VATIVEDHTQEAQKEPERRHQEESQPAKGWDARVSARLVQQHESQRGQGGEQDVQADPAQTGLSFRGGLCLDYGRCFHNSRL